MIDWTELLKMTVALLAVVDPFGTIPFFVSAVGEITGAERRRMARTVAITVFTVLAVAALAGDRVLGFFGISLAAFMVGGGLLLLLHAVSMLQVRETRLRQTPEEAVEATAKHALGVVPIGIPLLAGPGAISSVIIYANQVPGKPGPYLVLVPVVVVAATVWATFRGSGAIAARLGVTGLNIVTRLMGLLLAAMAVEIIARGLARLFPGLQ
ncbi:MAG: NAAT family transporter [Betaproteobacteria bacterium]|nr:NAAT family transporter [Betaproteobacteria bacterium]